MKKQLLIVSLILVVVSIAARLLPHLANIAPVGALALFAGVYLPRRFAYLLPIIAMVISDIFLGFYEWPVMAAVYGSFLLMVFIGSRVQRHFHPLTVGLGALSGSVIFFLLTNFATWAFTQMYPHTWNGLMWAYTMGLPFFKWTVIGDLAWSVAFFGGYALAQKFLLSLKFKNIWTKSPSTHFLK